MIVQRRICRWAERCREGPTNLGHGVEQAEHDHLIAGIAGTLESIQALDDRFADLARRVPAITAQRTVDKLEVCSVAVSTQHIDCLGHRHGHLVGPVSRA